LLVHPAASLPVMAKQNGARLIIVNRDPTPADAHGDLVVSGDVSEILPAVAKRLLGA